MRVLTLLVLLYSLASQANEVLRPQSAKDLLRVEGVTMEAAVRVKGAKVAWANWDALRRDFPVLRDLNQAQISDWLVENFAYIGESQPGLDGIRNSPIPKNPHDTKHAFRPSEWRRAAVLEARSPADGSVIGMVDIKGVGHGAQSGNRVHEQQQEFRFPMAREALRTKAHSDGLMSLGEAVAEVTRQTAAQTLFEHSGLFLETVESYAIIALPIQILKDQGRTTSAALYLRQAHTGRAQKLSVPPQIYTDKHGGLQKTSLETAVDFGGVIVTDQRLLPSFGPLYGDGSNPQDSKPWAWGHEVARAYAERDDVFAIYRHLDEMLAPLKSLPTSQEFSQEFKDHLAFQNDLAVFAKSIEHLPYEQRKKAFLEFRATHAFMKKTLAGDLLPLGPAALYHTLNAIKDMPESEALALLEEHYDKALAAKNSTVQTEISNLLRARDYRNPLRLLKKLLANAAPEVRANAARVLAKYESPEARELCLQMIGTLGSLDPKATLLLLPGLKNHHDERVYGFLEKALAHPESSVRKSAFEILAADPTPQALGLIERSLTDLHDLADLDDAFIALKGRSDSRSLKLLELALTDPQAFFARFGLQSSTAPEPLFLNIRTRAAQALSGRTDPASLDLIKKGLLDPVADVKINSGTALFGRDEPEAFGLAKDLYRKEPFRYSSALRGALEKPGANIMSYVELAATAHEGSLRVLALGGLKKQPTAVVLSAIRRGLADDSEFVRFAAVMALEHRAEPEARALLSELLHHPKAELRLAANQINFRLEYSDAMSPCSLKQALRSLH